MRDTIRMYAQRVLERLTPEGNLTSQMVKSGVWAMSINVGDRLLQILVLIVLARLLTPDDFGLIGIALLTLATLDRFSRTGLNEALIHEKQSDVNRYLNTLWTIHIARGVVLAAITFTVAPYVADFFDEPRVTLILHVMAVSPIFWGIKNPGVVYFDKNLDFHRKFVYQMSASLTQFVVAIGIAFVYHSVWALVLGYITADAVRALVSYLTHSFRPVLAFDPALAREMLGFGQWILATSMVTFLVTNGDDIVVGWLLPTSALGFYQFAYRLGRAPASEIADVIGQVMFPTYSKLQDDIETLRNTFIHTLEVTALVTFPVAIGIISVAPTFVKGVLGAEWLPMVPVLQIVGVYALLSSFTDVCKSLWMAIGRPDYHTKLKAVQLVCIAVFVYPMTDRYGIVGAALVVIGTYLVLIMPLSIYLAVKSMQTSYWQFFAAGAYPFAASVIMGVTVFALRESVSLGSKTLEFVVLVTCGVVTYLVVVMALEAYFQWGLERYYRVFVDAFRQ